MSFSEYFVLNFCFVVNIVMFSVMSKEKSFWEKYRLKVGMSYQRKQIKMSICKNIKPRFVDSFFDKLVEGGFLELENSHPMPGYKNGDLFKIAKQW